MKKLTLLLFVTNFCSIMYAQEESYSKTSLPNKPAPWMRPKKTIRKVWPIDKPISKQYESQGYKLVEPGTVEKKLPISGKHEFWNKFISGYSDDQAVEQEMKERKMSFKKAPRFKVDEGSLVVLPPRGLTKKEYEREEQRRESENRFLSSVEKQTPQSYVKSKADTGLFSRWRNWRNNLWQPKNTITYSPVRSISVPFQSPESE